MNYCIRALSPLFTPKVIAALAASHYVFLKEVPIAATILSRRVPVSGETSGQSPTIQGKQRIADACEQVLHCIRICNLSQEGSASRKGGKTAVRSSRTSSRP